MKIELMKIEKQNMLFIDTTDPTSRKDDISDVVLKTLGPGGFANVDIFAIVIGPGSWTGIRIGIAAVKAWAMVLNKPIVTIKSDFTEKELSQKITGKEFTSVDELEPFYDGEPRIGGK